MPNNVFYRLFYRLLKSFYRFFFFFYRFSSGPGSSVWAHSAFTHPVCLVSFHLEPYLGLSLSPVSLSFLESTSHLFYRLSSFQCVCCFLMVRFKLRIVLRYNTERRQLLPNGNGVTDIGGAEGTGWIVWCWVEMKDIKKNWRAGKQRSVCVWCVCMCVWCVWCVCMCVWCVCVMCVCMLCVYVCVMCVWCVYVCVMCVYVCVMCVCDVCVWCVWCVWMCVWCVCDVMCVWCVYVCVMCVYVCVMYVMCVYVCVMCVYVCVLCVYVLWVQVCKMPSLGWR